MSSPQTTPRHASTPPSPHSSVPKTNALLLPEVLFELALHLDFYSLLHAQQVCRTWKSVIDRSRQARQTLFLEPSNAPFDDFKAAEDHDMAQSLPPAFDPPQTRIPLRPEFRALFNPWIYTFSHDPLRTDMHRRTWHRRIPRLWRFTDRISAGRLEFRFMPFELTSLVDSNTASFLDMFLTQPPARRLIITAQVRYMPRENFVVKKDDGVRIRHVVACLRDTLTVEHTRGDKIEAGSITVDLKPSEYDKGVAPMQLRRLVVDQSGNIVAVPG